MDVSPFGLSKVVKGEELDIPREGVRLPHVKKIGSSNLDQTEKFLLGRERIKPAHPTPRKARLESRYGLIMWKHLQGQKP